MHNRLKLVVVFVLVAAVAGGAMAQRRSEPKSSSAYQRLDQSRLADNLSTMGMYELLDAMTKDISDNSSDAPALFTAANVKIALARREVEDLNKRKVLQTEAATLLLKAINMSKPASPEEELQVFRYHMAYIVLCGYEMNTLYGDQMMMLVGGDQDLQAMAQNTAKVCMATVGPDHKKQRPLLDSLDDKIQDKMEDWNQEARSQVLYSPQLERIQAELRYYSAWIRFYRGLSATDTKDPAATAKERVRMLNAAAAAIEPWVTGENEEGVTDPSAVMLTGLCHMELGRTATLYTKGSGEAEFALADQAFKKAIKMESAEPSLKVQLQFQIARNLIEGGKFAEARTEVDTFAQKVTQTLGTAGSVQADLNVAMLRNFLYARWAQADKANSAKYQTQAQDALVSFIEKYKNDKAISSAFFRVLASKFRGMDDTSKLPEVVQYAIASDLASSKDRPSKEKARDILMRIKDVQDESLRSQVNFTLGLVRHELGEVEGDDPGKVFVDSGSREGVLNGCIVYKKAIEDNATDNLPRTRRQFIKAIGLLLTRFGDKDPKLAVWNVDLGEQYARLAIRSQPDQEMVDLLNSALAAYAKVPASDIKMSMEARHTALGLEFEKLNALKQIGKTPEEQLTTQAKQFTARAGQYSSDVAAAAKAATDGAFKTKLDEWGADSEFMATIVMYEQLNQKAAAMAKLRELPGKWPKTTVLLSAKEYEIRKLVESGDAVKAAGEVEALRKDHPEQATALMRLVINQLQKSIAKLRMDKAKAQDLAKARKIYLELATILKSAPGEAGASDAFKQMYADALLENGRTDEALGIFEGLNLAEQANRKKEEAKFDADVDKLAAPVSVHRDDAAGLIKIAEDLPKTMAEKYNLSTNRGYLQSLALAVEYLKKGKREDVDDYKFRTKQLVDRLGGAFTGLRKDLKNTIPRDSVNIYGLARAYRGQAQRLRGEAAAKKYDQALKHYRMLVDGIDPREHKSKHWEAQLEYCQCAYEGLRQDKTAMLYLSQRIADYLTQEPEYKGEFVDLKQRAELAAMGR